MNPIAKYQGIKLKSLDQNLLQFFFLKKFLAI